MTLPARARRRGRWRQIWPVIRRPGTVARFLMDRRAPALPRLGLLAAMLYFVVPIDLIPDLAPVLGWLDDLGLMTLALGYLLGSVAKHEAALLAAPAGDARPTSEAERRADRG